MEGTCKLCGQTANLVESHVIPKALHQDTLSEDGLRIYSASLPYGKNSPSGIYGRFVCQCCENSFGPYDDYGVTFVRKYENGKTGEPLGDSFEHGFIADVDYARLKLWILSMLWRADACDHEFFDKINLGDKWRNTLTESVRCQAPGSEDDFAVAAMLLDEDIRREMLQQCVRTKLCTNPLGPGGHRHGGGDCRNGYEFHVYRGFTFYIKVDQRKQLSKWVPLTLKQDESFLRILRRKFSQSEMKSLKNHA